MPADPSARFVEAMGQALTDAGLAAIPSRLFAALLVDEDGRMTVADLTAGLGISPAAVSGAVKFLEQLDWLRREREPGTRHDVYAVHDDAWHDAMLHNDVAYRPMVAALERAADELPADHPARLRLDLTREFLVFMGAQMEDLAARWESHREAYLRDR